MGFFDLFMFGGEILISFRIVRRMGYTGFDVVLLPHMGCRFVEKTVQIYLYDLVWFIGWGL